MSRAPSGSGHVLPPSGYRPLESLDEFEQRADFQAWVGTEWIYRPGVPEFFRANQRDEVYRQFVIEHPTWRGVRRGMTPQELILSGQLVFGRPLSILLSSEQPTPDLRRVRHKELLEPADLVRSLLRVCWNENRWYQPESLESRYGLLVHDGRTGHAVSVSHLRKESCDFVYFDPMPGRSMLCAENNAAGADAKAHEGSPRWWDLSVGDLLKVIYALVIPTHVRQLWRQQEAAGKDAGARFAALIVKAYLEGVPGPFLTNDSP
jgi:hypothetical protein